MAQRARPAVPAEELDVKRCLSFVNTLSGRASERPSEKLASFDSLVAWARDEGLFKAEEAERLISRAKRRQSEAERVLAHARELRELVHETLTDMSTGRAPRRTTLDELSARLAGWYRHGKLVACAEALHWVYAGGDDLDRVLWEVSRAASRLLTSSRVSRVHACESADCGWWFVDDTKNRSRRWCDMTLCGNREKLRRFRQRSK
jgi:predicted RNA-binding Zn ribbon-like protein